MTAKSKIQKILEQKIEAAKLQKDIVDNLDKHVLPHKNIQDEDENSDLVKSIPEQGSFPTSMQLSEIYNLILSTGELIISIPEEEHTTLRLGLIGLKAKENTRLKAAGEPTEKRVFSFTEIKSKLGSEIIDIHIQLTEKAAITVLGIRLPDNSI